MASLLSDKMDILAELKQKKDRIKQLKMVIEQKRKLIENKRQTLTEREVCVKRIEKFASEKSSEGKYYQEVFRAFKGKLSEDQRNST